MLFLGKNGAGKSTLMKILSGAYMRDAGKVFLDGQEIQVKTRKNQSDWEFLLFIRN